ncbi:MAG: DoxX family protein [Deltaproteobacteria bacterium]|nr:DoxX family protein [Deltaproteobacteria bacterium]
MLPTLFALRRLILAVAECLAWLPPTLARFTVGWIFFWSGWGKLHDLDSVIQFFAELGIPHPELQAPFASGNELVCGALLLVGLCTRLATVPMIIVMIVALATAQRENVAGLGDLFGLVEYLYIALLVWIGITGPGPLSVDALLVRLFGDGAAALPDARPASAIGRYERAARV